MTTIKISSRIRYWDQSPTRRIAPTDRNGRTIEVAYFHLAQFTGYSKHYPLPLLYSYKNAFEKLAAGKSQIKSNEDEWDQLKKIKNNVLKNFPLATILRPSIVYSVEDNFTTNFMTLLSRLPVFPIYYGGNTRFAPIACSDLTDTIHHVISNNIYSKIIECVGPEIITFKEILQRLLNLIDKKRILLPFPLKLAKLSASFFELLPKPLLTMDQLRLLKYDNIASGKYKTNSDIGMPSKRYFNDEVKKYCYMWREGGQFSTEKYTTKNDLDSKTIKN